MKDEGRYLEDEGDVRNEGEKQKVERAYEFMVGVGVGGGMGRCKEWVVMDELGQK